MSMADNEGELEQNQDEANGNEEADQHEGETLEGNDGDNEAEATDGEADGEVVITLGQEAPPDEEEATPAPAWVKDLRKADREKARKIRELEQQLAAKATPQADAPVLGAKPTLETVDYDTDRYETELAAWYDKKRTVDDQAAKQQREADDAKQAWNAKLTSYNTAKASLKVADFEDAEATALEQLDVTQQAIILEGCKTPAAAAQLMYALGKNPAELKRLASIKNPVQYAFAAADLVNQMKVTPRKAAPAPEKVVRGNSTAVGVNDPKLARLEEAARKSGDRTQVVAYNIAAKAKAKA